MLLQYLALYLCETNNNHRVNKHYCCITLHYTYMKFVRSEKQPLNLSGEPLVNLTDVVLSITYTKMTESLYSVRLFRP